MQNSNFIKIGILVGCFFILLIGCQNPCKNSVCFNDAACVEGDCQCPPGFEGDQCEIKVEVIPEIENEPIDSNLYAREFIETMNQTTPPLQPTPTSGPVVIDEQITVEGDIICTTRTVRQNGEFGELVLVGGLNGMYLGQTLLAHSIPIGAYTSFLYGERNPICASTDLPVNNAKFSFEDRLSDFRNVLTSYLDQPLTRTVPLIADYSYEAVYSEEQLKVAIGGSIGSRWAKVSASYDFSSQNENTRYIIRYVQPFFSANVDPVNLDEYYKTPPTIEEMQTVGATENGLVYISQMIYGRQLFFMLETSSSTEETKAAINAEFNAFLVNGDFKYYQEHENVFKNASMRVLVMGGDPTIGTEPITAGLQGVSEYIKRGSTYSEENQGVPLSYQLRSVKDNSIFNTVLASEYPIRECEVLPPNITNHTFQPNDLGPFCPPLVRGDREIGDSGEITAEAELYTLNENELWAKIHYKVYEIRADHSTAEETWRVKLYTAPHGQKINKILSPTRSYHKYRDYDHGIDVFEPLGPVFQFLCVGDTPGDDLGNCTGSISNVDRSKVKIKWKPITLEIQS